MQFRIIDTDKWQEILATLSRNKTRTFLTAFGIFWGTAMLALLHGGATGMAGMVTRQFRNTATNMGVMFPGETSMAYKGYNKGHSWSMTFDDLQQIRAQSSTLDLSTAMLQTWGKATYNTQTTSTSLLGVEDNYFRVSPPILVAGRLINDNDVYARSKVAVVGKDTAAKLFGGDGTSGLGKYLDINGTYFRVVGLVAQRGDVSLFGRLDNALLIPATVFSLSYNTGNNIQAILFTAKNGHSPEEVMDDIRAVCCRNHPIHPDDKKAFGSFDVSKIFEQMNGVFGGIDLLALFVGIGTLLAGVIGVGNIMWIIVRERTQEIGIRRAIGARPSQIISQVLSESIILTVAAGTLGILFAVLVLIGVDYATADPLLGHAGFTLSFTSAIVILIAFLVLGTLAGLVPAIKAMRIKPVEAMRSK